MITYRFRKENGKINDIDSILSKTRRRLFYVMNGEYELCVKKVTKKRSVPQNKLYWLWLGVISDETGHTENELHDLFKGMFLTPKFKEMFGKTVELEKTTTELSTDEFCKYLTNIEVFARQELGITLPDPKDLEFEDIYNQILNRTRNEI